MRQDGGYNWPEYEGAYWFPEHDIQISYHKRKAGAAEWSATAAGAEDPFASASSARELAEALRAYAVAVLDLAGDVEGLEPVIPEQRPSPYASIISDPIAAAIADEMRPGSMMRPFLRFTKEEA